ncbi:hypothetical protein HAX54_049679 [Datura stramonium]|uniref:Uncharacterized protein n=1 Tax=Datura stramonium TaxID=4076 RepID=A0ABS8SW38_DATST|nr:hypothetical protein [Datura stramonium]
MLSVPASSHSMTGGVYKARERIHHCMADRRLLAIPASCRPDGAMSRGAAAVIQRMQALSEMIGRKASVGGFLSPPSNPRAQPWTGAPVWSDCELAHDPLDFPEISYESLKVSALLPNTVKLSEFIRAIDNLCGFPLLFFPAMAMLA